MKRVNVVGFSRAVDNIDESFDDRQKILVERLTQPLQRLWPDVRLPDEPKVYKSDGGIAGCHVKLDKWVKLNTSYFDRPSAMKGKRTGNFLDEMGLEISLKTPGDLWHAIWKDLIRPLAVGFDAFRVHYSASDHYGTSDLSGRYVAGLDEFEDAHNENYSWKWKNEEYNSFKKKMGGVTLNQYKTLFNVSTINYWDESFCNRVLKCTAREVLQKLEGEYVYGEADDTGVYVVFDEHLEPTYQRYFEINARVRPLLGLPAVEE